MDKRLKDASLEDLKEEIERREVEELQEEYNNLIRVQEFIKRNADVLKELARLPGVCGRDLESAVYAAINSDELYDVKIIACIVPDKKFKRITNKE